MELIVLESTNISVKVLVLSDSLALHSAILKFTIVSRSIREEHGSLPIHVVLNEIALINPTRFGKVVLALSVELAINEVTFVGATLELKLAFSCLLSHRKVTRVLHLSTFPSLHSMPILQVVRPFTLVHGSFGINKHTVAFCLAVLPLTLVDVSIRVVHPSFSVEQLVLSLTLVARSVTEFDFSQSLPVGSVLVPEASVLLLGFGILVELHPVVVPVELLSLILHEFRELFVRHQGLIFGGWIWQI